MKVYIGTSGWYYQWNEDKSLDWYLKNSGLNAIELNASFYRFPFPNQIKSWLKKGRSLHWSIKVNKLITHQFKFSDKAINAWQRFYNLFSEMEVMIDYFLFQLPPSFTPRLRDKITMFIEKTRMTKKFALEPRNDAWFKDDQLKWAESLGITWVSIDAPELSREIYRTTANVYLRIHGRTGWYHHNYKKDELKEIAKRITATEPDDVYIFFNNNHNMLKNAQLMRGISEPALNLIQGQSP